MRPYYLRLFLAKLLWVATSGAQRPTWKLIEQVVHRARFLDNAVGQEMPWSSAKSGLGLNTAKRISG